MGKRGATDEKTCFDGIYAEHHRALHAYFLGRTSDPEAAVDLLQEAFLRAWRNISKLFALPDERQRYWLYAVARNLVTDYYRSRASGKAALLAGSEYASQEESDEAGPQEALEKKEQVEALGRAIRELPEDLRTTLTLSTVGGLSSAGIGELLDVPAGTVRYRLSAARKQLAKRLRLEDVATGSARPQPGEV